VKPATRRIRKQLQQQRRAARAPRDWRSSAWSWRAAGAVLVLVALLLSWRVESSALRYQQGLRKIAGAGAEVVDLGRNALPSKRLQGDLVRVVGMPQVIESPRDPDFNQSSNALLLRREVAMFQWQQVNVGYPIYELEWVHGHVDSSAFTRPAGHANPPLPIASMDFPAPRVRLHGFILAAALVKLIPGHDPHPVDAAALPPNLAATFSAYEGDLYSGNPTQPRLGEVRLRWSTVPPQEITVLARVDDGRLLPAPDASVQLGDRSLGDLLPQLPPQPYGLWVGRIIGWLLAALGVALLLRAQQRDLDPLLTLAAGAVPMLLLPTVLWMTFSIRLGLCLLAASLIALGIAWWRWRGGTIMLRRAR
jgi:hypothetical protein